MRVLGCLAWVLFAGVVLALDISLHYLAGKTSWRLAHPGQSASLEEFRHVADQAALGLIVASLVLVIALSWINRRMTCPACKKRVAHDARICPYCRTALKDSSTR